MDATGKKPPSPPQTCAVCSETSHQVAIHYTRLLCNGCRAFFKRTVQGKMKVSRCKLRGECKVNTASRKDCKPCRYKACLKAGVDINKVQPARDTSAESSSRERRTGESDESSRRIQSRLETAPPIFPEHFQYPIPTLHHPHQYHLHPHAYPHLPSIQPPPTVFATAPVLPPPAHSKLYPVPLFTPTPTIGYYQHYHHNDHIENNPRHHISPYITAATTIATNATTSQPQNICKGANPLFIVPTPPTTNSTNTSYDFSSFDIHQYNNISNKIKKTCESSDLYHHSQFTTPSNHQMFPFVGICNPHQIPENSSQTEGMETLSNLLSQPTRDINVPLNQNDDNSSNLNPGSNQQSNVIATSTYVQTQPDLPTVDFPYDIKQFSGYDLAPKSKIGELAASSQFAVDNKIFYPIPLYAGSSKTHFPEFLQQKNFPRLSSITKNIQVSHKSSTFMIDTLLEQNTDADTGNENAAMSNSNSTKVTHLNNSMLPVNVKQENMSPKTNDTVTIAEPESTTDVYITTTLSPTYEDTKSDLNRDANCPHEYELSKMMSPIHNDGDDNKNDLDAGDESDDIFILPVTQPTTHEVEQSKGSAPAVRYNHERVGISRERLTSTPNQKKHPFSNSPEVEVDVINTPSPINANHESSVCSNGSSEDNSDAFESRQKVEREMLQNTHKSDPASNPQIDDRLSLFIAPESSSEENSEKISIKALSQTEGVVEKCAKENVSQSRCSDDSGMDSHSYNKSPTSTLTSTSSSSSSSSSTSAAAAVSSTKANIITASTSATDSSLDEITTSDQKCLHVPEISKMATDNSQSDSGMSSSVNITTDENTTSDNSTSNLTNDKQKGAITHNGEYRGSYPGTPLKSPKGSTPRKWKRFSSNENVLLTNVVNSPKRVKCVSLDALTNPTRLNTSNNDTAPQTIKNDVKEEKQLQSAQCRERLGEIKNFDNSLRLVQNHHKDNITSNTSTIQTSTTVASPSPNSNDTNSSGNEKLLKGNNCTNVEDNKVEKSGLPEESKSGISTFLDSIIQRIRNADTDAEVRQAKQDLQLFYSSSDFK